MKISCSRKVININKRKDGKYADILTEIAEHIYREDILKTQKRYRLKTPDGNNREIDVF